MNEDLLTSDEIEFIEFSPIQNGDAISIIKQPDGNWRGFMSKHGNLVQVRDVGPETVLQLLLTHPGK